jgi:hypothetical protein
MTAIDHVAPPAMRLRSFRDAPSEVFVVYTLLAVSVVFIGAMSLDTRLVNGLNPWIKPLKFSLSLALFIGTLAWFAHLVPSRIRKSRRFRRYMNLVFFCILIEMLWIGGAAFLATTSHFNVSTPFWFALYGIMGVAAVTLTTAALVWGIAIWRHNQTGFERLVGASFILTFVLTLPVAGYMSVSGGHVVGDAVSDAGGMWLLGWSREVGDLRVAHFFATHAMQIVPVAYAMLLWLAGARLPRGTGTLLCCVFSALTMGTFVQALAAQPFLPWL